jgi:glycosyltransferase involved in cell wall biosynthesis
MSSAHHDGDDVTVMVCAHNAAHTIGATLASIAGQTIKPAAVIVVDDGSTDETSSVAEHWNGRLPIELVRLDPNRGVAAARITAMDHTTTELVAILDADDVWLPDHLATLLATLARAPGIVAAQPLEWIPGAGVALRGDPRRHVPPPAAQLRVLLHHNFVSSGTLFTRADYDRVGGYRADLGAADEDWDLWIRLVRTGTTVTSTDHPTLLYRLTAESLSSGYSSAPSDVQVMQLALEDAADAREHNWARRGLHRMKARLALSEALEHARAGNTRAARRAAALAVRGAPRVAMQAAVLMVMPRLGIRARDRVATLRRRVKRS